MSAVKKEQKNIAYGYLEPYTADTKYDAEDYTNEDWYKYIETLHYDKDKHISLMKKMYDEEGKEHIDRYSIPIKHINRLKGLIGDTDVYLSINSHYCLGSHSGATIGRLNALFVDLDYKKIEEFKELEPEQMLSIVIEELNIPLPTICKSTGNGLMLEWRLNDTKATKKATDMWSDIEKTLVLKLKSYGADQSVTDTARVTRLVGSKNSKGGNTVTITNCLSNTIINNWDNLQIYELSDFKECIELFPLPKKAKPKKANTSKECETTKTSEECETTKTIRKNNMPKQYKSKDSKIKMPSSKSILELYVKRANDIEKLAHLRKHWTKDGWRELLFFLYALNLMYQGVTTEIAFRRMENLNEILAIPLDLKELEYAFKSSAKSANKYFDLQEKYDNKQSLVDYFKQTGVYMYSNAKIIDELNISEEEEKHMDTLIGDGEKKVRKKIRNKNNYLKNQQTIKEKRRKRYENDLKKNGKLSKKQQIEITKNKVKNLRINEGLKIDDIAKQLGIGVSTVKRHITDLKKEGLL